MAPTTQILSLSVALLALGGDAPETTLEFAPAQGSRWVKTFSVEMNLEGADLAVVMDGEEIPPEFLPDLDMTVEQRGEVRLTDTYVALGDGRPARLRRSFDAIGDVIESSVDMGGFEGMEAEEGEVRASSGLEGEVVVFTWDEDAGEYEIAFAEESSADATLLDGLVEDTDLRAALPAGAVEVGDEWTVGAEALAGFFTPGGDLGLLYEGDDADEYNAEVLEESVAGELTLTLEGVHESDGVELATVAVEGELTFEWVTVSDLARVPGIDGAATEKNVEVHTVDGELVWNLSAGYLHSVALDSTVEVQVTIERDPEEPGPTFRSIITLAGECEFRVSVEPIE